MSHAQQPSNAELRQARSDTLATGDATRLRALRKRRATWCGPSEMTLRCSVDDTLRAAAGLTGRRHDAAIRIGCMPQACYYRAPGDEDDVDQLHTTSDPAEAERFATRSAALRIVERLVRRSPAHEFLVCDLPPTHSPTEH